MTSIADSLAKAIKAATSLATSSQIEEQARVTLLKAANELVTALEKPEDALTKLAYSPSRLMTVRVCLDLGIFDEIVEKGTVSSAELAHKTGADKVLIERFLRVLTSSGIVGEAGMSTYVSNELTKALHTRTTKGMIEAIYDVGLKSVVAIPEYFRQNGYKNPDDSSNGPFQFAEGIKGKSCFEWLEEHPKEQNSMQTFFEGTRGSRPNWVDWFPVKDKLFHDATLTKDDIVLVDVAGGRGHELEAFIRKFPDLQGRYVLQDLAVVVSDDTLVLDSRVEKKAFNFWKDAPISGARIYYMKFIMHDWCDEKCLQILNRVTSAMTKGFSLLVIEDFILPDTGCHELPAMWDMQMMAFLSAMERTRTQWRQLLDAAGMEIEGLYPPPGDGTGIIVAKLKE